MTDSDRADDARSARSAGSVETSGTASADRAKAFTDAVVAIAMTLLILPLLDTISDSSSNGESTGDWLAGNAEAILLFVLSFVIIANFWMSHHRLFDRVELVSDGLLWISIAWMLTIVWLPVATALTGQLVSDGVQRGVYIGSMALTSALLFLARDYLRRHPDLHRIPPHALARGLSADIVTTAMFLVCLAVAVAFPRIGYYALLLMLLVRPIHVVATRILRR